jgi:hypothetical protein
MGKVCMTCFESYGNEISSLKASRTDEGIKFTCPKRSCRGEVIEIDDILVPTIVLLNEKGYYTESSCSGHLEEMSTTAYIIFNEIVEKLPSLPPGYRLSAAITEDGQKRLTLAKPMEGESTIQVFQLILTTALQTYAWALSLPYADYEEDEVYYHDKDFFENHFPSKEESGEDPSSIDPEKLKKLVKTTVIPMEDFINLLNGNKPKDE